MNQVNRQRVNAHYDVLNLLTLAWVCVTLGCQSRKVLLGM